jgi:uncharacterized protein YgiM (DUF1202 family)
MLALFFVVSPSAIPAASHRAVAVTTTGSQGGSDALQRAPPAGPYAARVLDLYEGPSEDYDVIGTVGKGASLEVVGKSEDGGWLAVSVRPASPLYVWVRPWDVANRPDMSALPVKPAVLVPNPRTSPR